MRRPDSKQSYWTEQEIITLHRFKTHECVLFDPFKIEDVTNTWLLETLIMLRKEVLLFCGFKLLPDFCKLAFSFPDRSSLLRLLSDMCDAFCLLSPLSSNLTSEWVWARVKEPPTAALPTSSVLWNLPPRFVFVDPLLFSLEKSAIFARTPDSFSSSVTV